MTRGTKCRSKVLCACLAAVALLAPTSASAAGPAAVEEYVLTLPGVESTGVGGVAPIVAQTERAGRAGVVGEQDDDFTRLGAVGAAVTTPAGIMLVVLALAGAGLGLLYRRERG